jgi:hypothetical protein
MIGQVPLIYLLSRIALTGSVCFRRLNLAHPRYCLHPA